MATIYLDAEEQKLRAKNQSPPQATPYTVNTSKPIPKPSPPPPEYDLELTSQGKAKSLHIAPSTNPQYKDFIHLWYRNNGKNELYVGYLKRDSGDFKFKPENQAQIQKLKIEQGTHFTIRAIS